MGYMTTGLSIDVGARVVHNTRPELGFGWVKYLEEDVFGDARVQVDFENESTLQTISPEEVSRCDEFTTPKIAAQNVNRTGLLRRLLCGAVLGENNLTGAFLHTSTQPLPHQAFALDKILGQDRFGHLLADDVGLGKTIEAGLIISTLRRGDPTYKVLIVVPASLALQWKEEMQEHFGLHFKVLSKDFSGKRSDNWQNISLVIASIDTLKRKDYGDTLNQVGPFNLVVCDESHRLSAKREMLSKDLVKSQNYELFERLVADRTIDFVNDANGIPRSPRLLLLSATPHQGDNLRFVYLLNLIRPDLFPLPPPKQDMGEFDQEALKETVTRTPKSVAHDWDGKPLFKGHKTTTCEVRWSEEELAVSRLLTDYIHSSLSADTAPGWQLVVHLVMHTFHKIAASSWAAIAQALKTRRSGLLNEEGGRVVDDEEDDTGQLAELWKECGKPFFAQELQMLNKIIAAVESLTVDSKWDIFRELLFACETKHPGCHILVFTQYKNTQKYLSMMLEQEFPGAGIEIVNGDVPLDERWESRRRFEQSSRFMISTEAGGEGINLQKASHIMFNYDLPWNPMRLQQRIGRLDRYGQQSVVSVFNLVVPNSWDAKISLRILERLDVIQSAMEGVTDGLEDYHEMILGNVAESLEPAKLFAQHIKGHDSDVDEMLDQRLEEAIQSKKRWQQLFSEGLGLTADSPQPKKCTLLSDDLRRAYAYALQGFGIKLQETRTHDNKFIPDVYHFTLPDAFRDPRLRPTRECYVVFDRDRFNEVRGTVLGTVRNQPIKPSLAGFSESVTDWLFQAAFHARKGECILGVMRPSDASVKSGWILAYALRWQYPVRRMLAPDSMCFIHVTNDGDACEITAREIADMVLSLDKAETFPVPDFIPQDNAISIARTHLKQIIMTRGDSARSIAGLFLHAAIYLGE